MSEQGDLFSPPWVKGSETSAAAADSMIPHLGKLQRLVVALAELRGPKGFTCDEAELALKQRHQSVSARIRELVQKGLLLKTELKRKTSSGRQAFVYIAPEHLGGFDKAQQPLVYCSSRKITATK